MKRIFAILLATLMCLSFVGCRKSKPLGDNYAYLSDWEYEDVEGETNNNTDKTTSNGKTTNKKSGKKNSNVNQNTNIDLGVTVPKGEYDFGGKTVRIAVWNDSTQPTLGKDEQTDAKYYAMHYAMQKYNVGAIEYKQMAKGSSAFNSAFVKYAASGDFWGDITLEHTDYAKSHAQKGLIKNLKNSIGKIDNTKFNTDCYAVKGNIYGFSSKSAINMREAFLIYNTDLIKKNNLEDPQSVYSKGQWTWSKYQEYVRTITDSNKDIFGMAIPNFHQLFNDPGINRIYLDGDTYKSSHTGGPYKANIDKIYNWIIEMYNEGSILGDFLIGENALSQSADSFRNGKVGFIFGTLDRCKTFKSEGLKNFSVVAAPTQNGEHKYYNQSAHYSFYAIPSSSSNYSEEMLLAFCNDLFNTLDPSHGKAYYKVDENKYADELASSNVLNKKDATYLIELGKVTTAWYSESVFVNNSFQLASEMLQPVLQGKSTWAKVTAQYGPQHQADIDKSINSNLYK